MGSSLPSLSFPTYFIEISLPAGSLNLAASCQLRGTSLGRSRLRCERVSLLLHHSRRAPRSKQLTLITTEYLTKTLNQKQIWEGNSLSHSDHVQRNLKFPAGGSNFNMVQVYLECLMSLNAWVAGSYLLILDGCFQKKNHHFLHLWWKFLCVLNFIPPTQRGKGRWAGIAPLWLNAKGSGPTSLGRSIHVAKAPKSMSECTGWTPALSRTKFSTLGKLFDHPAPQFPLLCNGTKIGPTS